MSQSTYSGRARGKRMKVVVIGGGIIGCLTACFLKQRGADVVVLERRQTGQEASWAGAGILCPIHPWLYPDSFSHLVDASLALYPELQARLFSETGVDVQWLKSGLLIPCFDDDAINHSAAAKAWSERMGWDMQSLDAEQSLAQEPCLNPHGLQGGLLWPDVAQVRNPRLLQATRAWMLELGVEIIEQCEVIELLEQDGGQNDGNMCGVKSRDGRVFEADAVLLASGSWSGELASSMGFELPIKPVKGQMVLIKGKVGQVRHIVKHDDAYFVPRADGRILIGASMEFVGFERGNTDDVVGQLLASMQRIAPSLAHCEIEQQWMGFRPGSPDGLPFMGKVPDKKGLFVAAGHYRNGVVLAPITAELMSRSIVGEAVDMDMSDFAVGRAMPESSTIGFPD